MASTTERNKDANTIHMNGTMNHSTQQDAPTPPALATTVTHINTGDTDYGIDSPPPSGNDNDVVHPHTNNAANAAAVAKSALLILSQPGAGRAQHVYVCSIPGELRHGQPIHLITSSGHIFTTTVAQLTQDVGGRSPLSSTPPNSCLSLPTKSQKISDTKSVTSPLPSSSTLIQNNQSYPFPSSFCKSESLVCEDVQEQSVQKLLNATKDICMSQFARGKINATGNGLKRRSVDEESLDAGVSVDGINLEEIKEFAKSFKLKRLSLGLTQTQVGQALSMTEGPAYSQSAICRFEKLDITPKSAQKIKPVLEKWMGEVDEQVALGFLIPNVGPVVSQDYCIPSTALTHAAQSVHAFMPPATLSELNVNVNGTHTGSGPGAMSPASIALVGLSEANRKRKRRTSFTPQALDLLNQFFERNTHPTGAEMTALAESLGYDREVVRVWFCNKRQALKNTIKKLKHCHDAR